MKPRLLDLFCGAGGCTKGYQDAGFYVVGVDIEPQPRYVGDEFCQGDALEFVAKYGHEFDIIHASPPCQLFSAMSARWNKQHTDMITPTRNLLKQIGKPYVIENVPNAPLINPLLLCGTMFGLRTNQGSQLRRHRLFECSPLIIFPPYTCQHNSYSVIGVYGGGQNPKRKRLPPTIGVYGRPGGSNNRDMTIGFSVLDRQDAMGIKWMINVELSQAIPPAYTKWIGQQMMEMCFQ